MFVNSAAKTGYVLSFQVYTGKVELKVTASSKGVAHRVVIEPYLGKGHWVFVDNYYTSPALFLDLLEHDTYATGTARSNRRYFPQCLKAQEKQDLGNYHFATSGDLLAVRWTDRRDVYMLSTAHNTSVGVAMKRPKGSREKHPIPCPTCVSDYNEYMGGVDLTDQHISYYSLTQRRTLKWWEKILWRMVDISILNSWIIFRTNFPESEINSHRLFRLELAHELVQPLLSLKASTESPLSYSKGRRPSSLEKRLQGKHFPYKQSTRERCVVCYNTKTPTGSRKDTKTTTYCPKCEVALCIGVCFEVFHTKSKYQML